MILVTDMVRLTVKNRPFVLLAAVAVKCVLNKVDFLCLKQLVRNVAVPDMWCLINVKNAAVQVKKKSKSLLKSKFLPVLKMPQECVWKVSVKSVKTVVKTVIYMSLSQLNIMLLLNVTGPICLWNNLFL